MNQTTNTDTNYKPSRCLLSAVANKSREISPQPYILLDGILHVALLPSRCSWRASIPVADRENALMWKALVIPALRDARVLKLVEGEDKAPEEFLEIDI